MMISVRSFGSTFMISAMALLVVVIVLGAQVPSLLAAVASPSVEPDQAEDLFADHLAKHETTLEQYADRFTGRSLFFKPKAPVKIDRQVERPKPVEAGPMEPAGPVISPTYAGPSVLFALGDEVHFHGPMRLRVGEESNGVKVLATDPPWSVTLAHKGGEYEVSLIDWLDRQTPFFSEAPAEDRSNPVPGLKEARIDTTPSES